jgi:hypothetical protein
MTAPLTDQQLADQIECAIGLTQDCGGTAGVHAVRDAVLAVVQPKLEQLRAELDACAGQLRRMTTQAAAEEDRLTAERETYRAAWHSAKDRARKHATQAEKLRAELAAERRRRETATGRLLHFAAEAHRRKWAYDQGGEGPSDPAFTALHQIGDEMRAAVYALRTAASPAPTTADSEHSTIGPTTTP